VGSIKDTFFCLDKKVDFIINPFTYSALYFDNSTTRVMKQNKVYPLVFMADYLPLNRGQKIGFLKNVFKLVKLAKKHSLPVFIASGAKNKNQIIYNNEFLYPLFDISLDQASNFFDILFRK
jgi:RNase P/RNase MRP subunit p30